MDIRVALMIVTVYAAMGESTNRLRESEEVPPPPEGVCSGAPVCPPAPTVDGKPVDCTTSKLYRYVNGVRCEWGCKHWCCTDPAKLTCPEADPSNPYCIKTHIVKYTINGRQCPVYCGCIPDCRRLTC